MLRIIDMKCSVLHQEFDQEQAVPAATQPARGRKNPQKPNTHTVIADCPVAAAVAIHRRLRPLTI